MANGFVNEGVIELAGGWGGQLTVSAGTLTNSGTIDILTGRTLTVRGTSLAQTATGVLRGSGTLDVVTLAFSNSGTIAPGGSPGVLAVTGDLTQGASATFDVELGGTTVGSGFDQLAVTGSVGVAGTLNIVLIDGFTPAEGNTFTILSAGSRAGTFDTVTAPALGGGLELQVQYGATAVTLIVAPVPQ